MPDTYRVQLQISEPVAYEYDGRLGYLLKAEIVDQTETMTPNVFLHAKRIMNQADNIIADDFRGVCTADELSLYPEDAPDGDTEFPFFRKTAAYVWVPSKDDIVNVRSHIYDRVRQLVLDLNRAYTETYLSVDEWLPS